MAFDPNYTSSVSSTQNSQTTSTPLNLSPTEKGRLSGRTVSTLPALDYQAQADQVIKMSKETFSAVCSEVGQELVSLVSKNSQNELQLNSEKVSKLITVLDSLDVKAIRNDFRECEQIYFNSMVKTMRSSINSFIQGMPLLAPIFTEKRAEMLLALHLAPATKSYCAKVDEIAPLYHKSLLYFARKDKSDKNGLTFMDQTAEVLSNKLHTLSKDELKELQAKVQLKSIGKLDPSRFLASHFESAQQVVAILEKLDKDSVGGQALMDAFFYMVRRYIEIAPEDKSLPTEKAALSSKQPSSQPVAPDDLILQDIERVQNETVATTSRSIVRALSQLITSDGVPKLNTKAADALLAAMDKGDWQSFRQKMAEFERLSFDYMMMAWTGFAFLLINKQPLLNSFFTWERKMRFLALQLAPIAKAYSEKIAKISPSFVKHMVEWAKEDTIGMALTIKTTIELAEAVRDFSKEELAEMGAKVKTDNIGDLDFTRFSSSHRGAARFVLSTLKEQLAQDRSRGELILAIFNVIF